jgi:hypothetical protein
MSKHIVDQPRDRNEGTRIREYTRIEREQGGGGPHPSSAGLQRRAAETPTSGRRTEEFLRRKRADNG